MPGLMSWDAVSALATLAATLVALGAVMYTMLVNAAQRAPEMVAWLEAEQTNHNDWDVTLLVQNSGRSAAFGVSVDFHSDALELSQSRPTSSPSCFDAAPAVIQYAQVLPGQAFKIRLNFVDALRGGRQALVTPAPAVVTVTRRRKLWFRCRRRFQVDARVALHMSEPYRDQRITVDELVKQHKTCKADRRGSWPYR